MALPRTNFNLKIEFAIFQTDPLPFVRLGFLRFLHGSNRVVRENSDYKFPTTCFGLSTDFYAWQKLPELPLRLPVILGNAHFIEKFLPEG